MRDILFRGKRKDNGEWTEGCYAKVADWLDERYVDLIFESEAMQFPHSEIAGCNEVESETVGQYTGLIDKNGKQIFEGDVVRTKYGRLCIVVWFSTRAYSGWDLTVVNHYDNVRYTKPPTDHDMWDSNNLEVIGNIHDNPEYLEVNK